MLSRRDLKGNRETPGFTPRKKSRLNENDRKRINVVS